MNKATKPRTMNIIALLFAIVMIAGIFLTIDPGKTNSEKQENVEKLKEIAADTTIKNIKVEYKEADPGEFSKSKNLPRISNYNSRFYQSMLTVVILLMFFILVMYLLKKRQKMNFGSTSNIKIIDRKYLGQKQFLATVVVDDEKLLLGVTDQSINLIKKLNYDPELEKQKQDENSKGSSETFPKILGKIRINKNEK